MIRKEFPDLQWLKKQAEDGFSNRKGWGGQTLPVQGWPSVILNVRKKDVCRDNIRGPLSVFTNVSGKSEITCGSRKVTIPEGFFFVTNHDQHYTLEINKSAPAETFNIHLGEYLADQALNSIISNADKLLESPFTIPSDRIEFHNKLCYRGETFDRLITGLKQCHHDSLLEEEKLYEILLYLVRQDINVRKAEHRLPVIKNSTRREISRRLYLASDYIYSHSDRDISLETLASHCCLSRFHFLRLFKIIFNKTPHQFINDVKVMRACELMKDPKSEIHIIAKSLGFTDTSTFSRMFHGRTGYYPTQFRQLR